MSSAAAHGLATFAGDRILDAWFPRPVLGTEPADVSELSARTDPARGVERRPITVTIDLDQPPADVPDLYLRLQLLSHTLVAPHGLDLDGIFGLLPNNAWTAAGPVDPAQVETLRARGELPRVTSVDKFPPLLDYVIPSGVRIADGTRVRLGAHLASGTTVMHEGFVNYNAGTLGASMVEGRISAGVVVGDGSDVGGGASIMGTLSGGGKATITIGRNCLIGANAGVGISLGDGCVVEAGLYVTAGTPVTLPDESVVKAGALSGEADLLFRRNGVSGRVEGLARTGSWGELNAALHAND